MTDLRTVVAEALHDNDVGEAIHEDARAMRYPMGVAARDCHMCARAVDRILAALPEHERQAWEDGRAWSDLLAFGLSHSLEPTLWLTPDHSYVAGLGVYSGSGITVAEAVAAACRAAREALDDPNCGARAADILAIEAEAAEMERERLRVKARTEWSGYFTGGGQTAIQRFLADPEAAR